MLSALWLYIERGLVEPFCFTFADIPKILYCVISIVLAVIWPWSFYFKLLFVLFSSGIWSCIAAYIYVDSDYMIIKRRICIEISRWGMIARTAVKKEENHYRTFSFTCSTVNELIVLREYNLPISHCFGIYNDLSPVNTYMIYRTSCCLSLCCVFMHECNVYSGVKL